MKTYTGSPWQRLDPELRDALAPIDRFLKELGPALARVAVGEVPTEGSGLTIGAQRTGIVSERTSLTDYLYLPGRDEAQVVNGDVTFAGRNINFLSGAVIDFDGSLFVKDSLFQIRNTADESKILTFLLDGATTNKILTLAWNGTADRTVTIPDSDTTLAGLSTTQTFLKPQTIDTSLEVGAALTLIAGSGEAGLNAQAAAGAPAIICSFTNGAFGAIGDGIWSISPTLTTSGSGIFAMINVKPDMTMGGGGTFRAFRSTPTITWNTGGAIAGVKMFDVNPTIDGSPASLGHVHMFEVLPVYSMTATLTNYRGIQMNFNGQSGHGAVTNFRHLDLISTVQANVTTWRGIDFTTNAVASGTVATMDYINLIDPTGAGAVTTLTGIKIANLTKATTNYSLDIGSAQSRHVGNFFFGAATNPTAKVHIAAGTTAANTAPLKFISGSLMTTTEAGAVEFLTDDLYITVTTGTARRRIATDMSGIMLLGSATIDMQTAATTTIYTTPASRVTRIAFAVVRDATASLAGGTSYTITGLRAAFSLAGLTTANTGLIIVRAADLVEQIEVAASTAVQLTVTTGSTAAANATIDVFGYVT